MKKFNQLYLLLVIFLKSSLCTDVKNATSLSSKSSSSATTKSLQNSHNYTESPADISPLDKSDMIDAYNHKPKNSSLKVAESRLFPVGHPGLIPQPGGLVSPFDVASFSNSLLPLITAGIREKVKDMSKTFNDGFDYVEDSIREGWRESPLNPYNYDKYLNNPPNLFQHLPIGNTLTPHYPHPAVHKHPRYKVHHKEKAHKNIPIESYKQDDMMHEFGINGYKHFEESILREIEKQEELKVEATIHTLFAKDDHIEIVRGKPYEEKIGWKPVAAPTKIYDDSNDITSQIISPLHTSFISASDAIAGDLNDKSPPLGFHDFDNFHSDYIHSTYGVHEEGGESKVKPVKAKITPVRKITPIPPIYSTVASTTGALTKRYSSSSTIRSRATATPFNNKRRHFVSTAKTIVDEKLNQNDSDPSPSASNESPVVVSATIKRVPSRIHIQSLTTSKPKNHANFVRNSTTASAENSSKELSFESTSRFRIPTSTVISRTTRTTTTTSTTKRPSKNVPREVSKFVDRARSTGYRGSVRYNQSTTKQGDVTQK